MARDNGEDKEGTVSGAHRYPYSRYRAFGLALERDDPNFEWNNPWDRMAGESDTAYAAFQHYMKLGPHRTMVQVYRDLYQANGKDTPHYMKGWSNEFRWKERARAWDEYQIQKERQAEEEERKQWREYRRQLLAAAFAKAVAYLNALDPETHSASLSQVTNLIDMVISEIRREYEALSSSGEAGQLPTIVYANINMHQYEMRQVEQDADPEYEKLIDAIKKEIE